MSNDTRDTYGGIVVFVALMILVFLWIIDEKTSNRTRMENQQLVIQYSQNGQPVSYWTLTNRNIREYCDKEKIEFIDMNGATIKLSSNYIIIEINNNIGTLKEKYKLQDTMAK